MEQGYLFNSSSYLWLNPFIEPPIKTTLDKLSNDQRFILLIFLEHHFEPWIELELTKSYLQSQRRKREIYNALIPYRDL